MSEGNGNGIIKLGKHGVRQFQYDDGTPIVKLDIIEVSNQWGEIDQSFRDEKGNIPKDRLREYTQAIYSFACAMLGVQEMSLTDANHFLKQITQEAKKLKGFFDLDSSEESSSQESSVQVNFSA